MAAVGATAAAVVALINDVEAIAVDAGAKVAAVAAFLEGVGAQWAGVGPHEATGTQ